MSFDWQRDPICVDVPPCPSDSGKGSTRSTPTLGSPIVSPVSRSRVSSPAPSLVIQQQQQLLPQQQQQQQQQHEAILFREQAMLLSSVIKKEPYVRHNIFQERSKLPANFHPHSHSNPDAISKRSSYFSMISTAASFFLRTVIDLEGDTALSFSDTSTLVQQRVDNRKEKNMERRGCYNLHGDYECCEDCAEEYDLFA
jgi:hypothetical protein